MVKRSILDLLTIYSHRYDYTSASALKAVGRFKDCFAFIFGLLRLSFTYKRGPKSKKGNGKERGRETINSHEELDAGNGSTAEEVSSDLLFVAVLVVVVVVVGARHMCTSPSRQTEIFFVLK